MIQSWIINRFESLETASAAAASFEADPRARTVQVSLLAWAGGYKDVTAASLSSALSRNVWRHRVTSE